MPRGKLGVETISDFKGVALGVSPTKIAEGYFQEDENGRRNWPHGGAWTHRYGYSRMCQADFGAVLKTSPVLNIFQFTPAVDTRTIETVSASESQQPRVVMVVTTAGDLVGFDVMAPRSPSLYI